MRRTNIYLAERQTEELDSLARSRGLSRAELVRQIIDQALDGDGNAGAADVHGIDRSFGALRGAEVDLPDRGAGAREAHLASMWELPA